VKAALRFARPGPLLSKKHNVIPVTGVWSLMPLGFASRTSF
jgi:hypothetical protein